MRHCTQPRGALALVALIVALATVAASPTPEVRTLVDVIVRERAPHTDVAERGVIAAGGTLGTPLPLIGGFVATVPTTALAALDASTATVSVTPDRTLHPTSYDGFDPTEEGGSTWMINHTIGAWGAHDRGVDGRGVDVAIIDSGVAPVAGLAREKIVYGPDLSFESQIAELTHLDTYGHGTHLAGIVAGVDAAQVMDTEDRRHRRSAFVGVAPGSRLVSLKVGDQHGAADVSQVIAAIDWVVSYGRSGPIDTRVLLLAYGVDSAADPMEDPLVFAVEQAWHRGVVVVVSAGNGGPDSTAVSSPARNPRVIAVGASDTNGTRRVSDDTIAPFSQAGSSQRPVDVLAPGVGVVSLRVGGSALDSAHPEARRGHSRLFRGSGTSQAAAVVAGAAALLIDAEPTLSPDAVKGLLRATARPLAHVDARRQGSGLIDVDAALDRLRRGRCHDERDDETHYNRRRPRCMRDGLPVSVQTAPRTNGLGSLSAARGGVVVVSDDGDVLDGDVDIFGRRWDPVAWTAGAARGANWHEGTWNGQVWSGPGWQESSLGSLEWAGSQWDTESWSGSQWGGAAWYGSQWDGSQWDGSQWDGSQWNGSQWTSYLGPGGWAGQGWGTVGWTTASWG